VAWLSAAIVRCAPAIRRFAPALFERTAFVPRHAISIGSVTASPQRRVDAGEAFAGPGAVPMTARKTLVSECPVRCVTSTATLRRNVAIARKRGRRSVAEALIRRFYAPGSIARPGAARDDVARRGERRMRATQVLIVEPDAQCADALAHAFAPRGPVAVSPSAARARDVNVLSDGLRLAIVDDDLPDGDGLEVAADLRRLRPRARVVLLVGDIHVASFWEARGLDLDAWPRPRDPEQVSTLRRAIEEDDVRERGVERWRAWLVLSDRQRDVLSLLVRGKSFKEIAAALDLSEAAVKLDVATIQRRAGATKNAELVAKFWEDNRHV
jgi:DNA-binding NarL/FixJ family response regulator